MVFKILPFEAKAFLHPLLKTSLSMTVRYWIDGRTVIYIYIFLYNKPLCDLMSTFELMV